MPTPEGTLERGIVLSEFDQIVNTQPATGNRIDSSILRLQQQLVGINLQKSVSEPTILSVNGDDVATQTPVVPHHQPNVVTPQNPFEAKPNWMTGIFGCLRPVLSSLIGKADAIAGDVKHIHPIGDDWEIPFEKISNLNFLDGGGQGVVFYGLLNNEPVAVKKVFDIKHTDIKYLKKLNHPNIVKFKGVCTQPPCHMIVMEFCPYGALYNVLKDQKKFVTVNRIVSWAKQIANGMHHLHAQKIIHRDLKSPNVLIGEDEIIKISDFGASHWWNGISEKMSFAGTAAWMAPEAIQGLACSEKMDIWSFGIVLWELLTCQVPYDGMERNRILYLVGSGKLRPPIPKSCPDGFHLIMEMCWKTSPRERPSFKLIQSHLSIASIEILGKFENSETFKITQDTWKEEIQSQITQYETPYQNHLIEFLLKEKERLKSNEMALEQHLYERAVERMNLIYMEYQHTLQLMASDRQATKRNKTNKRKLINPFRKSDHQRSGIGNATHQMCSSNKQLDFARPRSTTSNSEAKPQNEVKFKQLNTDSGSLRRSRSIMHRNNDSKSVSSARASFNSQRFVSTDAGTQTDSVECSDENSPNVEYPARVVMLRQVQDCNGNTNVHLHYATDNTNEQNRSQVYTRSASAGAFTNERNQNLSKTRSEDSDDDDEDNDDDDNDSVDHNDSVPSEFSVGRREEPHQMQNGFGGKDSNYKDGVTDDESSMGCKVFVRQKSFKRVANRRFDRCKYNITGRESIVMSDEGNTSEYSASPSSKSSTLESNPDTIRHSYVMSLAKSRCKDDYPHSCSGRLPDG